MAVFYSSCLSNTDSATSPEVGHRTSVGTSSASSGTFTGFRHARRRSAIAHLVVPTTIVTADTVRLFPLKSGDRLLDLTYSTETLDAVTTLTLDVGIYRSGTNHDGTVVDDNLFADAIALTTPPDVRVECLTEASLDQFDRGKTLWEMNGDTADPDEAWDITATFVTVTGTVTAGNIMFEATYISGD